MTGAISAILPAVTSRTVFSTRRANSGLDAQSPIVGLMNCNIAAGQIFKAAECTAELAKDKTNIFSAKIASAEKAIRAISKGDKVLEAAGKTLQFVGDNVNPIICATGGVKVLCSDDKQSALIQESAGLGSMFLFEGAAKKFLGMPKISRVNGKNMTIEQEALYKEIAIVKEGVEKFCNFCNNTQIAGKSLKFVPGVGKGLAFVAASIAGYKLGSYTGSAVAEKSKNNNSISFTNTENRVMSGTNNIDK